MSKKRLVWALVAGVCVAAGAQSKPHVLLISVDGMKPEYVTKVAEHPAKIPVLLEFMKDGTYADGVVGVFPTLTYPSHTTLVTGVWPGEHGIYANEKFRPMVVPSKADKVTYELSSEVKVESLWTAAKKAGLTTASISWPVTGENPSIDWNLRGKESDEGGAGMEKVRKAKDADQDTNRTNRAIETILNHQPNFMTIHLGLTDEAQHEHGPFSPEAIAALENIDVQIGRLMAAEAKVDPKAVVFVVSDHGFVKVDYKVNVGVILVDAGLIRVEPIGGEDRKVKIVSWDAQVWETGGSVAVLLRDPNDKAVYDRTYAALKAAAADPKNGIDRVLTRDYFVPRGGNPNASFFVALKPGYKAGTNYAGKIVQDTPGTGTHGYLPDNEPGVRSSFFVMGAGIAKGRDLGIVDMRQIAPTVAKVLGVTLPAAKEPVLNIH